MWLALRRKVGKVCRGARGDWHVRRVPRRDLMKEVMFEPSPEGGAKSKAEWYSQREEQVQSPETGVCLMRGERTRGGGRSQRTCWATARTLAFTT